MNEQQWLASEDPAAMIDHLQGRVTRTRTEYQASGPTTTVLHRDVGLVSDRKLLLFACAGGRLLARDACNFYGQTRAEVAVMLSACEDATDAGASDFRGVKGICRGSYLLNRSPLDMACYVARLRDCWHRELSALLRDIVGNPFRKMEFLFFLGSRLLAMTERVYEDRDFAALPILADALEDGGCSDPELLAHLRDGTTHVRGCWALDLLLGKE